MPQWSEKSRLDCKEVSGIVALARNPARNAPAVELRSQGDLSILLLTLSYAILQVPSHLCIGTSESSFLGAAAVRVLLWSFATWLRKPYLSGCIKVAMMIFCWIFLQIHWVVKVERFQWNERPSCAHATSKVDQCCVQLVSSKLVFFFSFLTFSWVLHCQRLCVTSYLGCVYTMFSWSHERTMKGNERKWKENERNMKANGSKGLGFDTLLNPCFWSTYLTSWSNRVPVRFDTILLNWSTLTVRCTLQGVAAGCCCRVLLQGVTGIRGALLQLGHVWRRQHSFGHWGGSEAPAINPMDFYTREKKVVVEEVWEIGGRQDGNPQGRWPRVPNLGRYCDMLRDAYVPIGPHWIFCMHIQCIYIYILNV